TIADIIGEINDVLDDLSRAGRWPDLYRSNVEEDRTALSDGDSEVSFPTGLRVLDKIVINDGTRDGKPLKDITFQKLLEYRRREYSSEPRRYARRGRKWYPDPIPDGDYTAKYWFWRYHPEADATKMGDDDDILFGDDLNRVIKYGVCAEVAKTHKMADYIALWESRYEVEKRKILPEEDRNIELAKYSDL
ncbi:unnamed protein product, partial [marine sediment metagenome]